MGELEEPKNIKLESFPAPKEEKKSSNHVSFHKAVVTIPDDKISPSKPPPLVQNAVDHGIEKSVGDFKDKDAALARVELEKRLALIKAWEDSEKAKAENKAYKKLSSIEAWENTKKASVEAQIKQIEEEFEQKKAEHREKMKNKMAEIHKAAEEKRAMIEAKKKEDFLKVVETAAKFRSTNTTPNKVAAIALYSALAEELETVDCVFDFHEVGELPSKTQHPMVER
ncbi:Remorin family protein [Abeliophyllum distichum]|uniref:Remorin family protein n=1 Tax=Abeliophyllum distichum TaxID=126358 RepID=A0ABD1UJ14_9LAMI